MVKDLPLVVEHVDVKGKFMWWTLTGGGKKWYMWSTYGMSGQWSRSAGKHAGFIVEYNGSGVPITRDTRHLFFNDQRRFGTIKFVSDEREHEAKLASLGPDILDDPPMDPEIFAKRILKKPHRTICESLMDQSCISGCGNYLKSEALYRAEISPHRVVSSLSETDIIRLQFELLSSAWESYVDQGASIRTYKTVTDEKGSAQFYFRIYNNRLCPRGHHTVREETLDGRTSWWCRECQV